MMAPGSLFDQISATMSILHFTPKQGQYLAFIHAFQLLHHGRSPAEADFQNYFRTTPPSVHRMIVALHQHGFIERTPGLARSIKLMISPDLLPSLQPIKITDARY
jgi:DNA-binding MarR family transcriptional regulator